MSLMKFYTTERFKKVFQQNKHSEISQCVVNKWKWMAVSSSVLHLCRTPINSEVTLSFPASTTAFELHSQSWFVQNLKFFLHFLVEKASCFAKLKVFRLLRISTLSRLACPILLLTTLRTLFGTAKYDSPLLCWL